MACHDKSISSLRIKNADNSRESLRSVRNVCEHISRAPFSSTSLVIFRMIEHLPGKTERNGTNCGKRCSGLRIRREISKPLKRQREPKPCTGRYNEPIFGNREVVSNQLSYNNVSFFCFLLFGIGYADPACDSTRLKSTLPGNSSFLIQNLIRFLDFCIFYLIVVNFNLRLFVLLKFICQCLNFTKTLSKSYRTCISLFNNPKIVLYH